MANPCGPFWKKPNQLPWLSDNNFVAGQTRGYVVVVYSCSVYSVDRASNVVVCVFPPSSQFFAHLLFFFTYSTHNNLFLPPLLPFIFFSFHFRARGRDRLPPTERRNNNLHISSGIEWNMPTEWRDLTDTGTSRHVRCPTNATKTNACLSCWPNAKATSQRNRKTRRLGTIAHAFQ